MTLRRLWDHKIDNLLQVNFGQYDNGGYIPYKPTMIRQKIPDPGTKEEQASFQTGHVLVSSALQNCCKRPKAVLRKNFI